MSLTRKEESISKTTISSYIISFSSLREISINVRQEHHYLFGGQNALKTRLSKTFRSGDAFVVCCFAWQIHTSCPGTDSWWHFGSGRCYQICYTIANPSCHAKGRGGQAEGQDC